MNYIQIPRGYHRSLCRALFAGAVLAAPLAAETPDLAAVVEQLNSLRAEVAELRQENQGLRQNIAGGGMAGAKAAPAPAAPTAGGLRFAGELRLRYEGFYGANTAFVDRNRFRYRLRFGATSELAKNLEVGLRLTTGVLEGEPTGNNATMENNASKKAFALDLAYAKWTAFKDSDSSLALIGGKMNNPFTSSDLAFDGDYTPEGFAAQYSRVIDGTHTLRFNAAQFVLDELSASAHDPMLTGLQARWDSAWSKQWSTTVGASYFQVSNASRLTNSAVPDVHKGNTRNAAGMLVHDYNPFVIDLGVTRTLPSFPGFVGAFPIRIAGDYLKNSGAPDNNDAYYGGVFLGKAGKKGTWEFNYRYRVMQADAWYEELADSDSGAYYQAAPLGGAIGYGGGTNVQGHIVAGNYALTDYAVVGFTWFSTELIKPSPPASESGMNRLQVNTILKF